MNTNWWASGAQKLIRRSAPQRRFCYAVPRDVKTRCGRHLMALRREKQTQLPVPSRVYNTKRRRKWSVFREWSVFRGASMYGGTAPGRSTRHHRNIATAISILPPYEHDEVAGSGRGPISHLPCLEREGDHPQHELLAGAQGLEALQRLHHHRVRELRLGLDRLSFIQFITGNKRRHKYHPPRARVGVRVVIQGIQGTSVPQQAS